MFFIKMRVDCAIMHILATVTPPEDEKRYPHLNPATSGDASEADYGIFGEKISTMIQDVIVNTVTWLFDVVEPFVNWGCKFVIVGCFIIAFCTGDKKTIATALKFGLIFLVFNMIRSVI